MILKNFENLNRLVWAPGQRLSVKLFKFVKFFKFFNSLKFKSLGFFNFKSPGVLDSSNS